MYAMELTEIDSDLMVFMKEPVPVATKSNKQVRTRDRLAREEIKLSQLLRENEKKYFEIDKQTRDAYNALSKQEQRKPDYDECSTERTNRLVELRRLEEQVRTIKYEWFMNRIKHSRSIILQNDIPNVIGQYNLRPECWHLKYCLFTREQKRKLLAYAQTIQAKRMTQILKSNPESLKRYNDACDVTLLMKEFGRMTLAQQKSYNYFEYQTNS
jgi:hypothetical protein